MSTWTLNPKTSGQDVWITNTFSYGDNYGVDNQELRVGGWGDLYYSLLKFELSGAGLPTSVGSATLRLYNNSDQGTPTGMRVDVLNTAWTESRGWHDQPALSYTNIGTTSAPSQQGWIDIDVTAAVNAWLANPSLNFGLQLRPLLNNNNFNEFVSSDAVGDLSRFRPQLVLQDASTWMPTNKPVALQDLPINGTITVTQGYDGDTSHNLQPFSIDIAAPIGTKVFLPTGGTIVGIRASTSDGADANTAAYGLYVTVRHDDGYYATYAHLSAIDGAVTLGAHLSAGNTIGLSGNTGLTTGPHLHVQYGTRVLELGDLDRANGASDAVPPVFFAQFFPSAEVGGYVDVTNPATIRATDIFGTAGDDGGEAGPSEAANSGFVGTSVANRMFGAAGRDTLKGLGGDDLLVGGSGHDKLVGGAGRDTLVGGSGLDRFDFNFAGETLLSLSDTIIDFSIADDVIDLRDIDASIVAAGNSNFLWRGSGAFTTSIAGEVRFVHINNAGPANDFTIVYGDIDADTSAEFRIVLKGLHSLTIGDFVL